MKKRLNSDNKKLTVSRDLAGAVTGKRRFLAVGVCADGGRIICARRTRESAISEVELFHLFNKTARLRFMCAWHYDARKNLLLPVAVPNCWTDENGRTRALTLSDVEDLQIAINKNLIIL